MCAAVWPVAASSSASAAAAVAVDSSYVRGRCLRDTSQQTVARAAPSLDAPVHSAHHRLIHTRHASPPPRLKCDFVRQGSPQRIARDDSHTRQASPPAARVKCEHLSPGPAPSPPPASRDQRVTSRGTSPLDVTSLSPDQRHLADRCDNDDEPSAGARN